MKATSRMVLAAVIGLAAAGGLAVAQTPQDDGAVAADVWRQLAEQRLVGSNAVGAVPYARQGQAHGPTLVTFQSTVDVGGTPRTVIVKRSYGEGSTREGILANPGGELRNVTVMVQIAGYDPENKDWFWAMYMPDGTVGQMEGNAVAGKVAMCSGCHASAGGGDYVFLHDGLTQ